MNLNDEQRQMVLDNYRLVWYLVKKMEATQNTPDFEDLVSIGTIGLMKAAMTYKEDKSKFATYASRCITLYFLS